MKNREIGLIAAAVVGLLMSLLCVLVLPGVRFTGFLAAAVAGLALAAIPFLRWTEKSPRGKLVRRAVLGLFCLSLALFVGVEGVLLSYGRQDNGEQMAAAVIVLGAGVNGERPSLILQSRIDAAAEYLSRHPETVAVLSGGQGAGEDLSEAEAMRRGLVALGIPDQQLLLETASTSTAENFSESAALLETLGLDLTSDRIGVVTSDFHCFRALLIARDAGMTAFPVPAKAPWPWLNANYYLREFFALGKTLVFD